MLKISKYAHGFLIDSRVSEPQTHISAYTCKKYENTAETISSGVRAANNFFMYINRLLRLQLAQ